MADKNRPETIAFDLDGTLALRQEPFNPYSVGEPVEAILDLALKAIRDGKRTLCFTARANSKDPKMHSTVRKWLDDHGLEKMKITNIKTPDITKFYDDRAIGVVPDKGLLLTKKATTGFPTAWGKLPPAPLPTGIKAVGKAGLAGVGKVFGAPATAFDLASSFHAAETDPRGVQDATNQAWNDAGTVGGQVQTAVGGMPGKVLGGATTGGLRALGALDPISAIHTNSLNQVDAAGPDPAYAMGHKPVSEVPGLRVPQPLAPSKPAAPVTPAQPTAPQVIAAPTPAQTPTKKASTSPENVSVPQRGEEKQAAGDKLRNLWIRRGQCPECGGKPKDFEFFKTHANAECRDCGHSFDVDAERKKQASCDQAQIKSASVQIAGRTGPHGILEALKALNLDDLEKQAKDDIASGKITKRDRGVKMLNALEGLRRNSIKPEELMIKRVPVLPPAFRPFSFLGTTYIPGDANELYQDLFKHRALHEETLSTLGEGGAALTRMNLLNATRALYGYGDPVSPKLKERGPSGYLDQILNEGPKHSFIHRRLLSKPIDNVGRSVITVDPDLGLDEVSIPREMAWTLAGSKVQRRLALMGMSPAQAIKAVKDRDAFASRALELEIQESPFILSRAPAWHKFNAVGQYARIHDGPHIAINPYITAGQGADFDGDQINVSMPVLPESIKEAKDKLMASKMLFSIKNQDNIVPAPKHEMVIGIWTANKRPSENTHTFTSGQEALKAMQTGAVKLNDTIEIPDEV